MAGSDGAVASSDLHVSVFVNDSERAALVLEGLRDLGVALAIDDFGTGDSSLGYLLNLPFDILEIDRVFIAALDAGTASRHIVDAIVTLGHRLDMTVVADGIETAAQHAQIADIGCDLCQGFFIARPTSADEVGALLAR